MLPLLPVATALVCWQPASPVVRLAALDRNIQAAAVEELAAGSFDEAELTRLWKTTDRFDVRAHVARVYERRGAAGLMPLLDLARHEGFERESETLLLTARSLAACGPDVLKRIAKQCEGTDAKLVRLLPHVARILDAESELAPIARSLTTSKHRKVRSLAALELSRYLPAPERSALLLAAVKDEGERRDVVSLVRQLPVWSPEDRAAHPEKFLAFLGELEGLLRSKDRRPARAAARVVRLNGAPLPHGAAALEAYLNGADSLPYDQAQALRAMVAASKDAPDALELLEKRLDREPFAVCRALADLDPAVIPDPLIDRVVAALPRCSDPRGNSAYDLIVPRTPGQRGLGARAIPALRRALDEAPDGPAAMAASVLGALHATSPAVLAATAKRFNAAPREEDRLEYALAMLALAPDEPETQAAVADLLRKAAAAPEQDSATASRTIQALLMDRMERPWLSALLLTFSPEEDTLMGRMLAARRHRLLVEISEADQDLLAADLLDTGPLEARLAFALARSDEAPPPDVYESNDARRLRAAERLSGARTLSPAAADALARTLVLTSRIGRESAAVPKDSPRHDAATVLHRKTAALLLPLEIALQTGLARNGAPLMSSVIERLKAEPAELVAVIGALGREPNAVPAQAARALLDAAEKVHADPALNKRYGGSAARALGLLPPDAPGRDAALLSELWFGPGDRPLWAFRALVDSRQDAPAKIALIREALADPRYFMREAGMHAAERLGPDASPLLGELLALSRRTNSWDRASPTLPSTLRAVSPADAQIERTASALDDDWRESRAE